MSHIEEALSRLTEALNSQSPAEDSVDVLQKVWLEFIEFCKRTDEMDRSETDSLHKIIMTLKTEYDWLKYATILACAYGSIRILEIIYNIDECYMNCSLLQGITAMHIACLVGDLSVAKWLHVRGASVVARTWTNQEQPVHWLALCGNMGCSVESSFCGPIFLKYRNMCMIRLSEQLEGSTTLARGRLFAMVGRIRCEPSGGNKI